LSAERGNSSPGVWWSKKAVSLFFGVGLIKWCVLSPRDSPRAKTREFFSSGEFLWSFSQRKLKKIFGEKKMKKKIRIVAPD